MKQVTIINATKATVVGERITVADTFFSRLKGLLGKRRLDSGCGLLIEPSSGVHTFGMLFAIDVVALDRSMNVIGVASNVGPWRLSGLSLRTRSVLELPGGQCARAQIERGDHLSLEEN